jgi:hypothetical protein
MYTRLDEVAIPAHRDKRGIDIDWSFTSPGKALFRNSAASIVSKGSMCLLCVFTIVLFTGFRLVKSPRL